MWGWWVSADDHQRLGRRLEQGVVDGSLVGERDVGDRRRQGDHDVVVGHGKKIPLARFEPVIGGRGLARRAMPVAARVISDVDVGAVLASADMAAEYSGAAGLDRQDGTMQVAAEPGSQRRPEAADDIRNLERGSGHVSAPRG